MTDDLYGNEDPANQPHLLVQQSLKYADDIAKVYEEEKAKRRELEDANRRLRTEIAERRRAEEAMRESEERFRAIFETAADCIYIKDLSFRYSDVNPSMERLLQLPRSAIIGKSDRQLYGKEASLHLEAIDKRVFAGESIEEEHTRPVQGNPVTFLETKTPLRDRSGAIIGLCGLARDITDRRRVQTPQVVSSSEYPSRVMRDTLATAHLMAAQESLILLLGESGAGKDFMARYVHEHSPRANGPFFAINCASVPPELAESELFGHESGAFTGARARKRGLLELAEGGTLFLNEIGELSAMLQAKLLTFLDTRSFARVGGEKQVSVNARLVVATNRNLEDEVARKAFRADLYYRVSVLTLRIPPLRDRPEDVPVLVHQILAQLSNEIRVPASPILTDDALQALKTYKWPGNVRELRNRLERAIILSGGGEISAYSLGLEPEMPEWVYTTNFPENRSLNEVTRDLKRAMVVEALRRSNNSRLGAAALLGISRNSLNHYLKSLDIEDE
jgi:PAS domain S-box-containing protein